MQAGANQQAENTTVQEHEFAQAWSRLDAAGVPSCCLRLRMGAEEHSAESLGLTPGTSPRAQKSSPWLQQRRCLQLRAYLQEGASPKGKVVCSCPCKA